MEIRSFFDSSSVEASDDGQITGLAAPFNRATMIGEKPWGFREEIAPGTFTKTLQEGDVVFLDNHQNQKPIARKSAGTLTLMETERGLTYVAKPVHTSYADDLRENIKAGNIRGNSFGFEVIKDDWYDDDGNTADSATGTRRVLREVKLVEVSACTFPAYNDTDISARDVVSAAREERKKAPKPYGNVAYADPKNGKYPIDTKAHCKAAWSYVNMPKNAAKYPLNGVSLDSVKAKIRAACKKFGVDISEKDEQELANEWRCYLDDYEADGESREDSPAACEECSTELSCPSCAAETRTTDPGEEARKSKKGKSILSTGTEKRIPQIAAELKMALTLFAAADVKSLPPEAQQAIVLVSSASTHAGHIQNHEGLAPADAIQPDDPDSRSEAGETQETREGPKPGESTSENLPTDDALMADWLEAVSREIELEI